MDNKTHKLRLSVEIILNPNKIRDIEYGRDTKLSSVQAVAKVLGLRLELVKV